MPFFCQRSTLLLLVAIVLTGILLQTPIASVLLAPSEVPENGRKHSEADAQLAQASRPDLSAEEPPVSPAQQESTAQPGVTAVDVAPGAVAAAQPSGAQSLGGAQPLAKPARLPPPPRRPARSSKFGQWQTGSETWAMTCTPYPGKRVVLVQANAQYLEMFRNWLFHASRFLDPQTDQLVIAAESEEAVPIMKKLSGLFGVEWDVQFTGSSGEKTSEVSTYGKGVWTNVVTHRPAQILQLLKQGCSVLYQDIDTVWTRSLFPELDSIGKYDMYMASDNDNPQNRYLCTCLMYYHPTAGNKDLMTRWGKAVKGEKVNQYPFNRVLDRMEREGALDFHVLSLKTFPPGKLAVANNRSAVVLHANYVHGSGGKVEFLRKFGFWNPEGTVNEKLSANQGQWEDVG